MQNHDFGENFKIGLSALHLCKNGHLGCFRPSHLAFGTPACNRIHKKCYGSILVLQDDGTEKAFKAHHHCKCPVRCVNVMKVKSSNCDNIKTYYVLQLHFIYHNILKIKLANC